VVGARSCLITFRFVTRAARPMFPAFRGPPPEAVLSELHRLAARIGIAVRAEAFNTNVIEGRGGLCWLRGQPIVVMDAALPLLDKIGVMAEALAAFDLEAIYVPPFLRAKIRARRRDHASVE
jgi:hypothetical protein